MSQQSDSEKVLLRQHHDEINAILASNPALAAEKAQTLVAGGKGSAATLRLLAAAQRRLGRAEEAAHVEFEAIQVSAASKPIMEALAAMRAGTIERAERLLRSYLDGEPDDPQALRMLAEIAAVCGHGDKAEILLRRALTQAPAFIPLYINLATLLQDLHRPIEAIALLDSLLEQEPAHAVLLSFKAALLAGTGQTREALGEYEKLIASAPEAVDAWASYADLLKAAGRIDDAIAAYRKAVVLAPGCGLAWWGLASLRTIRLTENDAAVMRHALPHAADDFDRLRLHFALGKALGDLHKFEESFDHYVAGNAIRGALIPYDIDAVETLVHDAQSLFAEQFLQKLADRGVAGSPGPIFIVGLPRSGSTLVEQILATHSRIEGLGELPDLHRLVRRFAASTDAKGDWLKAIGHSGADDLRNLGAAYLAAADRYRSTSKLFFTDKMPFNWVFAGLIALIFPDACIIDVRRHPMACCFSNFALNFNRETNFASRLEDLGRYYRAYVQMMDHIGQCFPGRIYQLDYEKLVEDPETVVRRLFDFIGLPFEQNCLRAHENPREIHTPSAAQVRRAINDDGLEFWKNYEPWLAPLRQALEPPPDPNEQ